MVNPAAMAVKGLATTHSAPRAPRIIASMLMQEIVDMTAYSPTKLPGANMKVIGISNRMPFPLARRHATEHALVSHCGSKEGATGLMVRRTSPLCRTVMNRCMKIC